MWLCTSSIHCRVVKVKGEVDIKDMEIPKGILFGEDSQVTKQRRWRMSSATWRLAALVGDDTLLIAFLVSLTNTSHLGLSVLGSVFGSCRVDFVWLCLALT